MDFVAENAWFQGIGAVRFDLHQGQVVEWAYPLQLTDDERSNVAFLSMPDTGIDDDKVAVHTDSSTMQYQFTTKVGGKQMFGWVVYMEKKDAAVERGALQRSIFLLSTFPWGGLARDLLASLADVYLSKIAPLPSRDDELYMLKSMLLNCWVAMSEWPNPECCGRFELETPTVCLTYQAPCFRRRGYCGRSASMQCPGLSAAEVSETSSGSSGNYHLSRYSSDALEDCNGVDAGELMAKLNRLAGKQTPKGGLFGGISSKFGTRAPGSASIHALDSPALPTYRSLPSFSSSASSSISCTPSSRASLSTAKRLFSAEPTPPMTPQKYSCTAPSCTTTAGPNFPFHELDGASILPCHVGRLHKLWEIMITGEPICVLGVDARRASETVRYLTTLVEPLTFVGDVNPYVTLHNTYVDQLTTCPTRGAVLGVTNPIFLKGLEEFPNVLIVGEGDGKESWFGLDKRHRRKKPLQRMDDQVCGSNMPNELFSERNFASKGTSEKDVRRAFQERTQRFLEPIHAYITDVIRDSDPTVFVGNTWKFFASLASQTTPPASLPQPFDVREILGYVAHYVESPDSKGQQDWKAGSDIMSVYLSFLSSPMGLHWFSRVYLDQYKKFLAEFDDLPTLLKMFPDPQDRLALLDQIVLQYAKEQASPIPDTGLTSLLATFAPCVDAFRMELQAHQHMSSPCRQLPVFDEPVAP